MGREPPAAGLDARGIGPCSPYQQASAVARTRSSLPPSRQSSATPDTSLPAVVIYVRKFSSSALSISASASSGAILSRADWSRTATVDTRSRLGTCQLPSS